MDRRRRATIAALCGIGLRYCRSGGVRVSGGLQNALARLAMASGAVSLEFAQEDAAAAQRPSQIKPGKMLSITDMGGAAADYAGTPLYDGDDGARITATDNTAAFNALVNSAIARGQTSVKIPTGHWGIRAGNLSFFNFDTLRIVGDGIGLTVIDFIKEDATHTGNAYVDATKAQCIAKFDTGNQLEFVDLTIKATTKAGVVTGAAGTNYVYQGAVWGFKIKDVLDVRFTRVRAEHFNYRGFAVYGTATQCVTLLHCEGFYNVGSGFWNEDAAVVRVVGGEFAYNGVFGEVGTGYGVTASRNVGKYVVMNPYCHHNYRKGIDSHGCSDFMLEGGRFENNVLFHFAYPNDAPPAALSCSAIVKGNTFCNGLLPADRAWLKACYDELAKNGYTGNRGVPAAGAVFQISDYNGNVTSPILDITIEDNKVIKHYNGGADSGVPTTAAFIYLSAINARVVLKNNNFNFDGATFNNGGNVYGHEAMVLRAKTLILDGNYFRFLAKTAYTNPSSGLADVGLLIELNNAEPREVELYSNQFMLNDAVLFAYTTGGTKQPLAWNDAQSKRIAKGNVFSYESTSLTGSATNCLNSGYFLGAQKTTVSLTQIDNSVIRNGVPLTMPAGGLDCTVSVRH